MTVERPDTASLLERFLAGDTRALARALTWVEAGIPHGAELVAAARGRAAARPARVVGITGPPGAGKSTLVDRLVGAWRARDASVAVLAIDPSSPFSGGALLGDRVRMTRWAGDAHVFVRSMASRGRTGGLAPAALDALTLLEGFGFDVVLLETVGVGQAEVDVVAVADTVVVALAPGQGDDVQAAKAGLMEVADVFALTKADRADAPRLAREVRDAVALRPATPAGWVPAVVAIAVGAVPATAAPSGEIGSDAAGAGGRHAGWAASSADGGLAELIAALEAHAAHQAGAGAEARRAGRRRFEVLVRAQARLQRASASAAHADLDGDPDDAAANLLCRAADVGHRGW